MYVCSVLAIGFFVSFRKGHSEDLFLAGRNLRWFNVGLSIFGTNVSPSFMIAVFAMAYSIGIVGANYEWLACIFLFILAMLFVPHYLNTKVSTMPEFLQIRYGYPSRVFLSWYVLLTTMWVWVGGTLFIGALMFSQILGWKIWFSALLLSLIATSFTVAGGLTAVVITDSFQSILLIVASAWMTIIGLVKIGGIDKLVSGVPEDFWILFRPASDPDWPWPAIIFGYPVLGIWFWCTDQTIVQRVLGARNLYHGQAGCVFAGFIKILTPLIFFVPGVMCRILHPNLENSEQAYITMVVNHMPVGGVGLIIAVIMAALISTIDSGLNSLSTVFTLEIYKKHWRPDAASAETKNVGRIVTVLAGMTGVVITLAFDYVRQYMDLFTMSSAMIGFFAPPMSAVFIVGVLWRRATPIAGFLTLVIGTVVSLSVGVLYLFIFPDAAWWPHSMLVAFYLFMSLVLFEIIVSLFTRPLPPEQGLPPVTFRNFLKTGDKSIWVLWGVLSVIMITIYLLFNRVFW